jgi:DNA repair exonuclease SbcCD nuclease subunit
MGEKVRFVHASDLHLDASFGGVDAADDRVASTLARSTLEALDRVVELCLSREVDFLLIAGDLYNSADRSLRAELHFQRAMRRLDEAGIPAFVVHGNHDPADGWSAGLELPESTFVFPADRVERREVARDGTPVCAVYGRSYPTRQVTENLAVDFRRDSSDPLAIGLLHANVGGREGHEDYAPCTVDDLRAAGMDYWALGHIHLWGRVASDPPVLYSGSTQGLNPTEDGPRGCLYVELGPRGASEEFVETASVLWRSEAMYLTGIDDLDGLRARLMAVCEGVRDDAGDRPSVLRLELLGRSPVHSQLVRPGVLDDLLHDLRQQQLEAAPWIWVDRLRDGSRPDLDLEALLEEEGLVGDVARIARARIDDDEAAAAAVDEIMAPPLAQLGVDARLRLAPRRVIERARDLCFDLLKDE